jgi:hypothetical protein
MSVAGPKATSSELAELAVESMLMANSIISAS